MKRKRSNNTFVINFIEFLKENLGKEIFVQFRHGGDWHRIKIVGLQKKDKEFTFAKELDESQQTISVHSIWGYQTPFQKKSHPIFVRDGKGVLTPASLHSPKAGYKRDPVDGILKKM